VKIEEGKLLKLERFGEETTSVKASIEP